MSKSGCYKTVILGLIMSICFGFGCLNVKAENIQECEYTEEYIAWLKLDDIQKSNVEMPRVCKMDDKTLLLTEILLESEIEQELPSTYTITDYYDEVRNQKMTETCWAYSAISVVESYFAKNNYSYVELAPLHIEYATAVNFLNGVSNPYAEKWNATRKRSLNDGGNFGIASAYFAAGRGPVKKEDFNVSNENTLEEIDINDIDVEPYADVNDTLYVDYFNNCSEAAPTIKNHLMNYGAVSATVRYDSANYYNPVTYAYYYNGDETSNHAITIVGWDDNYSKSNFGTANNPNTPQNDGAWLVLNSYGSSFGNNGYFYISYEDTKVCNPIGGVRSADTEFTDNQYIYDYTNADTVFSPFGGGDVVYAANTFYLKGNQELLKEVRVKSYQQTNIDVYIIDGDQELNIDNATYLTSGVINGGGYSTLKLEEPYVLNKNQFTIIVKYNSVGNVGAPFVKTDDEVANLSFTSVNGKSFHSESTTGYYASIKAYTDNYDYEINSTKENLDEYKFDNKEGGVFTVDYNTVNIPDNEVLDIHVFNSDDEDVSELFNVSNIKVLNNAASIRIVVPSEEAVTVGTYTLRVRYLEKNLDLTFDVMPYVDFQVQLTDTLPDVMYNNVEHSINYKVITTNVEDNKAFSVQLEDPTGNLVNNFTTSELKINNNEALVNIKILEQAIPGVYTLKYQLDNKKASTKFTITEYILLEINVDKDSYVLSNGDVIQLSPIINDATNKEYSFVSLNSDIATVSDSGLITAVSSGDAVIKIVASEDENNYKEINVKVVNPSISISNPVISSNAIFDNTKLYTQLGGSIQFDVVKDEIDDVQVKVLNSKLQDASGFTILGTDTMTLTYDSSVKNGTYIIEVKGISKPNGEVYKTVTDTYEFTIEKYIPVTDIIATDVTILNSEVYILNYSVVPGNATIKDVDVTSTKSDTSGTLIINNGNVVSITPDLDNEESFVLTITSKDGANVSKDINIVTKNPEPVILEEKEVPRTLFTGTAKTIKYNIKTNGIADNTNINAIVKDSEGNEYTAIGAIVSALTSGEAVVSVDISDTALMGTYTLAVSVDGQSEVRKTFKLIDYSNLTNIKFDKDKYIVVKGNNMQLSPVIPIDASLDQIEWTVDDPSIASVSDDGVVTGILPGLVTIKATSKDMPNASAGNIELFEFVLDGNVQTEDDKFIINSGTIKYYEADPSVGRNDAGNRIGFKITAPAELVYDDYKYARITRTTNFKDGSSVNKYMYFDDVKDASNYFETWPLVSENVASIQYEIEWTSFLTQTTTIEIGDGVTFERSDEATAPSTSGDQEGFTDNLISPNVYEAEVQVQVIDTNVTIGEVIKTSNASFDSSKLYEILGGNLVLPLTLNDYNNLDIKVYNEYDEEVTGFIIDQTNPESINITYNQSVEAGDYHVIVTASFIEDGNILDSNEDRYDFVVEEYIPITNINIEDITMLTNETKSLENIISPSNATYPNIDIVVGNNSILEVVDGVIKPKDAGTTTITINTLDDSNVSKTINVEVIEAPISITILPKDIPLEIYNGKDNVLNFDIKTVNVLDGVVPTISVVDGSGNVVSVVSNVDAINNNQTSLDVTIPKGVEAGNYTLKVTIRGTTEEYSFVIKNYIPLGISLDNTYVVPLSDSKLLLDYTIDPNATSDGVIWTSSDDNIATVSDSGLVSLKTNGTVVITGTAIGYSEDYVETTIIIVDSSVVIDEDSVTKESTTPFSNDILYTYFGGKITFNTNLVDVNTIDVSILDSDNNVVNSGFQVIKDTISGNGSYSIKIVYDNTVKSGTYKVLVNGSYVFNDVVKDEKTDTYEFEIVEFKPILSFGPEPITMELGETAFLESLVQNLVINPEDATYKELDYAFDLTCEDCDTNSVSITTIDGKTNITAVTPGKVKLKITAKDGYLDEDGNAISAIIDFLVLEEDIFKGTDYIVDEVTTEDGTINYVYIPNEMTSVEDFINSLNINPGATALLKESSGEDKVTGNTGTGNRLHYTSRVTDKEYIIVLRGDVDGDGRISSADYVAIRNHIMEVRIITDEYLLAADKNEDNLVRSNDYVALRNIIMERSLDL